MAGTPLARRRLLALAFPLGAAFLTACGRTTPRATFTRGGAVVARPGKGEWPPIFASAAANVQAAYRFAVAHPEALRSIPCYCGCAEINHTNNLDCYVREFRPAGQVVLDQHGFGCGGCVGITSDVARLREEGRSPTEIRATIDATWKGVLPGTDTPLPGV